MIFVAEFAIFWAFTLNSIKADLPLSATQCNDVGATLGDKMFQSTFLKADVSHCILGLDFIANFKLDIRLSENTVTVGDIVVSIQVSTHDAVHSYTVNTVSLFKKDKINPHSGVNFSLRFNLKLRSNSDFVILANNLPLVDIILVMALKDGDSPITIVNHSDQTVTLSGGSVLGLVLDVVDSNIATPDCRRPDFEVVPWYMPMIFRIVIPLLNKTIVMIKQTLLEHSQDVLDRSFDLL